REIACESAGCATRSRCDARVICPSSITTTRYWSWRRSNAGWLLLGVTGARGFRDYFTPSNSPDRRSSPGHALGLWHERRAQLARRPAANPAPRPTTTPAPTRLALRSGLRCAIAATTCALCLAVAFAALIPIMRFSRDTVLPPRIG